VIPVAVADQDLVGLADVLIDQPILHRGFREMAFMSLTLNLVMMTCSAAAAATLTF
jgi:hypothetical protein